MIKAIFDETITRKDVYRYRVNAGGEENIGVENGEEYIFINFENGKFDRCEFGFRNPYTRSHWLILGAIAEKILEIEKRYKKS